MQHNLCQKLPITKDSNLSFNVYDLRVIKCGVLNNDKIFVAKVIEFSIQKIPNSKLYLAEIIPLYTIHREEGIFIKKYIQNYNNVHCLITCDDTVKLIKERWNNIEKTKNLLIAFIKKTVYRIPHSTKKNNYFINIFVSGTIIIISANVFEIYYKEPPYSLSLNKILIPKLLLDTYVTPRCIQVDQLQWHCPYLQDTIRIHAHKKSNITQNNVQVKKSTISNILKKHQVISYIDKDLQKVQVTAVTHDQNINKKTTPINVNVRKAKVALPILITDELPSEKKNICNSIFL